MKKIYVLLMLCLMMITCNKDVEPYNMKTEIKVSEIGATAAKVEAMSEEAGFDELDAVLEYSSNEDFSDLKQTEMKWDEDCFMAVASQLEVNTKYYYKVVFKGKYNSTETEVGSFTTLEGHPDINGHEYVDLGLPSGLKWATCNVGATLPKEYGNYYAWGETQPAPNNNYSPSNCSTYGLTYIPLQSHGYIDNKGNLTPQHDAATANWGGSWRLPTKAELAELKENCTWTWTMQNGVNGYKVTSKVNSNYIFLPAAGYRIGSSHNLAGEGGYYWSSTPNESNTYGSYYLGFYSGYHDVGWGSRDFGQSVRPVSE